MCCVGLFLVVSCCIGLYWGVRECSGTYQVVLECVVKYHDVFGLYHVVFRSSASYCAAGVADHGKGMLPGWQQYWTLTLRVPPSAIPSLLGCWPHIAWGLSHGKLLPVSHARHAEVCEQAAQMHLCATTGEWDRMVMGLYRNWGNGDQLLNELWNMLFVPPVNNWYIGYETNTPCLLPSQQV